MVRGPERDSVAPAMTTPMRWWCTAVLAASFGVASGCSDETDPLGAGSDGGGGGSDVSSLDASEVIPPDGGQPADDATSGDPDATAADAVVGRDANPMTMGDPTVEVLEVGTVRVTNGTSMVVTSTLPADVAAFMIVIDGPDDAMFIPYTLDGPTGNLVSADASMVSQLEQFILGPYAAQFKSPNRVTQDLGLSASIFPSNPGVTVTGGAYRLVVGGLTVVGMGGSPFTGEVTVRYYYRRAVPAAGRLDLHLYFTGAGGITVDSAPGDMLITAAVDRLRTIYGQASIELGTVSYHSADARFQTISDITGTGGDLEEMFQESAGQGRGLHFFFVDRFMGGFPGATVAGISGGLPGAPDHVGSLGAGVAVALSTANNDANVLAHVMAHEGGHWLGLFHTSEVIGTADQHPETPEGQGGNTYLMYPAVGGGTTISPSQGTVMRLHGEVVAR